MGTDDERTVEFVDKALAALIRQLSENEDPETAHIEADDIILGIAEKYGFIETVKSFREMERWYA